MSDVTVGISIAVAVAIHNIPEGIAVSVPVFYATGSKRKALMWSVLSGFSEPIGASCRLFHPDSVQQRCKPRVCFRHGGGHNGLHLL
ncbi:MAG: ZIP family metal transporter [Marinilabiliales bacterium]|nr:ZIP family metal transporter [Marinilabiliales bacterium]